MATWGLPLKLSEEVFKAQSHITRHVSRMQMKVFALINKCFKRMELFVAPGPNQDRWTFSVYPIMAVTSNFLMKNRKKQNKPGTWKTISYHLSHRPAGWEGSIKIRPIKAWSMLSEGTVTWHMVYPIHTVFYGPNGSADWGNTPAQPIYAHVRLYPTHSHRPLRGLIPPRC